ncbi:cuticle protein 19-like [Aphis gossypii]|uniref:cuticle protein 19-like n=1 Tax=Aphis gossypii TaxID=80765 RepID=UPI00100FF981|nr:cuticle protein 19-like [Aphis gossypii]
MNIQIIVFVACLSSAMSQYVVPAYPAYHVAPAKAYVPVAPVNEPTPYSFVYSVNDPSTYDVKSQAESSDGNGNVKGFYSLLEADGSTRTVEYTADDYTGFNAVVKKEGGYASDVTYKPTAAPYKPY